MSRFLYPLCILVPLVLVAADPPPAPDREPLKVGKDLPGPFNPYNVTGPHAGKFHCDVTEKSFEPGILVFVRNFNAPDALAAVRPLLAAIDDRIDKNYTRIRLNCTVVFLSDELNDVTGTKGDPLLSEKNDDLREAFTKQIKDLADTDPKLKYVVLTLDHKDDVKKYGLDDSKFVTVVLFKKLQIVAVQAFTKNDLTDKAIKAVNDDITDKLGATRK